MIKIPECDKCAKRPVCKYAETFIDVDILKKAVSNLESGTPLKCNIDISCSEYVEDEVLKVKAAKREIYSILKRHGIDLEG